MNILNTDLDYTDHVIISYSHADCDIVNNELYNYNNAGIEYWYDKEMVDGESYVDEWCNVLDKKTCKGVIFFISPNFLISEPCVREMEYYKNNYLNKDEEKFCLFIMLPGIPLSSLSNGTGDLYKNLWPYIDSSKRFDDDPRAKHNFLERSLNTLYDLSKEGKKINHEIGDGYIEKSCREGQLFEKHGVINGIKEYEDDILFGFFPQIEKDEGHIEGRSIKKPLSNIVSFYAPVEWIRLCESETNAKYLSKKLLLSIDYLGEKYPINEIKKNENLINNKVKEMFECFIPNDGWKVCNVRFLSVKELNSLLTCAKKDPKQQEKIKGEILFPETTHFSQISNRKPLQAFWLAGDMEDARWVDSGTEALSEQPAGVELFYVRVVIEVEKC